MNLEETFNHFKSYLQSEVACQEALSKLKPGVEVSVIIGEKIHAAVFYSDNTVQVEPREATNADVEFRCKPESIYLLSQHKNISVGKFGVEICKEVLAGNISIKVISKVWNLATNGYIDIIKLGGTELLTYLAQHGFATYGQIMMLINKLKKR